MLRVIFGPHFQRDLRAHTAYLRSQGDLDRIRRLDEDLAALEETVQRFPQVGRELTREVDSSLRRLRLRHAPLFVWYVFEPERNEIALIRLFHARQLTPDPRVL